MKNNDLNLMKWLSKQKLKKLLEAEMPPEGGVPDMSGGMPPQTDFAMDTPPQEEHPQDISQDPQFPEMPQEADDEDKDFELWKEKYINESIKGDPNKLHAMCLSIRDHDLEASPRKFVEDNMQICMLRQNPMIQQPSAKIRKLVKQDIDRNLPSTSLIKHMSTALDESPVVSDIFIKLLGTGGGKQDLHRKFIASLFGAAQVGSGAVNEDLIFQESEYSIPISTRFNTKWGDVMLGPWDLTENDPERFLKEPELERLKGGSPEERDVLRRRVVLESIADQFKQRSFIVTTVGTDGGIHHLGLDIGNCLQAGYLDGRLIVRSENSDTRRAFISDDGDVVSIPELTIYYVREGHNEGEQEEVEFIRHREGQLFLSAQADLLVEASSTLQGVIFKEVPWRGNPTDFLNVSRCTPSADEILLRRVE